MTYGVPEECRTPASVDATQTFCATNLHPRVEITFVHLWINLKATFDKIQRGHRSMRQALSGNIGPLIQQSSIEEYETN